MFTDFIKFEIKYSLTKISTWIYFSMFFLAGIIIVHAAAGAFSGASVTFGAGGEKLLYNSPYFVHLFLSNMSLFAVFLIATLMGNTIYRDFENKTFALFFSKPVSKFSYLMGRFFGNIIILLFMISSTAFGMFISNYSPWIHESYLGSVNIIYYIYPCIVNVLPNLILTGSLFFALAVYTRKILPVYIGSILLFIFYLISGRLMRDIDNKTIAALIDPLGINTISIFTDYWTVSEQNSQLIPFQGVILFNKMIWSFVSVCILTISYKKFSFSYFLSSRKSKIALNSNEEKVVNFKTKIPSVERNHNFIQSFKQLLSFAKMEFLGIIKSLHFIVICFAGLCMTFFILLEVGKIYGTSIKYVTYSVIASAIAGFSMISVVILTIYSGELIWRDREKNIDLMIDSTPVKNWVLLFSKYLAILGSLSVIYFLASFMGILFQLGNGFYQIELGLYASHFGLALLRLVIWSLAVFFIHVIVNQKYFAHLVVLVFYFFTAYSSKFGIEHKLLKFNSSSSLIYSDMNGFGNFLEGFFWFKGYWLFFGGILLLISYVFMVRGKENNFRIRIRNAFKRFTRPVKIFTAITLAGFIITGSYIYYNMNILHDFKTQKKVIKKCIEYELKYKKYESFLQPKYVDVFLEVDLFPEEQYANFRGKLLAKNKSNEDINTLYLDVNSSLIHNSLTVSKESELVIDDKDYGVLVYNFDSPLKPGESFKIEFDFIFKRKGFESTTNIVENGTFINNKMFMPSIGYNSSGELFSEKDRKKHNLPPRPRMAKVDDKKAQLSNYVSKDADWVDFEAIISTSFDQIAITPGYLQKDWLEGNRHYYHYKMDHKILNFFSFVSAKYEIEEDVWVGKNDEEVKIEIYYDYHHPYNVDRMIKSLKKSLTYYTENFSEYPHKQVRILEFPRYASFAQSFPNTIPFSESIGFIADVKEDQNDVDYPFYVTAHELAHQWWAHQVIGADVQGSLVMSEALAQYSALMVMEKEYGKNNMRKFLKHEMDTYLIGRRTESHKEMPLNLCEQQSYIYYNKGSVVMYALRDYIGEEALNNALSEYITAVKYQEPPYTTSIEFVEYLRRATPDSLQYVITDMFEKITLFENKTEKASYSQLENGNYLVSINTSSKKVYADSLGIETETKLNDLIDIVIYSEIEKAGEKIEKPIYQKKFRITKAENTFEIEVDKIPTKAGIDSFNKLIDRNPRDNTIKINKSKNEDSSTEIVFRRFD